MGFQEYTPRTTLYHYCTPLAFEGIISTKEIWFSDLRTSNDPRELRLGYDMFLESLRRLLQSDTSGAEKIAIRRFCDFMFPWYSRMDVFCCCFSLARDQLPMWGAYGGAYRGLSIGFRPTSMFDVPARTQKVSYIGPNTRAEFDNLIATTIGQLRNINTDLPGQIAAQIAPACRIFATKHNTWSYENEVRITHVQRRERPIASIQDRFNVMIVAGNPDGSDVLWTEPLNRASNGAIVSYKKFAYGKYIGASTDHRRAIEEVIIGPQCEMTKEYVAELLDRHGFRDYRVVVSDCAIRL